MSSYHSVLKNAQARMEEAGYGEQSALPHRSAGADE